MEYTRYEALFGQVELPNGKRYPIIICEVLADNIEEAYFALDLMGYPSAVVRPTTRDYHHIEYNMN